MPSPHSYAVPKMRLYEMFAQKSGTSSSFDGNTSSSSLPQQQPSSTSQHSLPPQHMNDFMNPPPSSSTNDLIMAKLEQMLVELDRLIQHSGIITFSLLPPNHDICLVMRQMPLLISQSLNPEQAMLTFLEKIVYMLYKSTSTLALEAYTLFLQSLFDMAPEAGKETLLWLVYADDERKYNASVISMLIRYQLLPLEEFDNQLAKHVQLKPDTTVINFASELIRICLLSSTPFTSMEDHTMTILALRNSQDSSTVPALMDDLRQRVSDVYPMIKLDGVDYLELRLILAEWNRLCQHPACHRLFLEGIAKRLVVATKDDDSQCYFLRMALETCVQHYIQGKPKAIHWVDALARLVAQWTALISDPAKQVALIGHTMSVIVLILAQYHENLGMRFNQKPFFRILSLLLIELCKLQSVQIDDGILTCYCDTLYALQPLRFPGFAVSWLQMISHRVLLPQLLGKSDRRGWDMYHKLVLCLLKFLGPLLDKQVLQTSTKAFYRGTLRYLVVLLHDFPEFLCEYYMVFVQVIPHSCIQLRNMVLSAFPLVMHFPDPLTPDLCLELLPECTESPAMVMSFAHVLPPPCHAKIQEYILGQSSSIDQDILSLVLTPEQTIREDVLNALVLCVAMPVIKVPLASNPALQLYTSLIQQLSSNGSYLLLSAMADHLRYPNSHTHFFSQALLTLFRDMPEPVKEQITRILLERLIVNRPHPWGLLATFIALIKEPKFWNYSFVRSSPEIERLFENVGRCVL
ncbi:Not1-domain-containing protein [Hesseltinella vesiculosa]|uniref:Not1-domain-containing protein n=1 Tax=Hesseltinella vesiculosa TaxID=101127 RepID=A0A1X2GRA9_9FUNG|nr:Not1-domain-containing protein [Hesseltinella vesiculosa]